ncbi:MAG: DUF998 domain-containing protein [Acholeplasmataceae bacterium]|nr:MAG: DUF998 domain-containing protein [Acholeplasmataceae bacterium]
MKKTLTQLHVLGIVYALLLLVMFIMPLFSVPSYSVIQHTTSQLGAQGAPHAWVMNVTFILLGLAVIMETALHLKKQPLASILLFVFGTLLIAIAFFRHAPIDNIAYRAWEDQVHGVLATAIGFVFTFFMVTLAFILPDKEAKVVALMVAILTTILSMMMLILPDVVGMLQRIIFIYAFGYLIVFFSRQKQLKTTLETEEEHN